MSGVRDVAEAHLRHCAVSEQSLMILSSVGTSR